MALSRTFNFGQPLNQRGQGAIEAILALPVFLILVCMIFQLFFLGIAQIQLQYAAFYAARSGAVNGADEMEMKRTVKRILAGSHGLISLPEGSLQLELLGTRHNNNRSDEAVRTSNGSPLMVRVHWHHPLIVPFADRLIQTKRNFILQRRPTVHLQASWATAMFEQISGAGNNARKLKL